MIIRRLRRCLWGVCDTPLQSWYTDILRIKMYPGSGVSHTPSKRFQRKRRGVPMHKNNHSPPPAMFGGSMLLRPTLLENLKSKNESESGTRVGAYCIRPINILSRIIIHCINTRLRRLRRHLWGVCCCVPTVLEEWNPKNKNAPTLSENLKSKKRKRKIRIHDSTCTRIRF